MSELVAVVFKGAGLIFIKLLLVTAREGSS